MFVSLFLNYFFVVTGYLMNLNLNFFWQVIQGPCTTMGQTDSL